MTEDRHSFWLGLAIIGAIVAIYLIGAVQKQAADVAVLTGLIGVLGTFTRRATTTPAGEPQPVKVTNDAADPVPTELQPTPGVYR